MKRLTFQQANLDLLRALHDRGWQVTYTLKVNHARSPDGTTLLLFRPQSIWHAKIQNNESLSSASKNAHSLFIDPRDITVDELISASRRASNYPERDYLRRGTMRRRRATHKPRVARFARNRDSKLQREKANKEKWNKRFEDEARSLGAPSHVNWSKANTLRLKGTTPEQAARSLYRNAARDRSRRRDVILTDARGRPFHKPTRKDFATDWEYVRATHEYNQRVTNEANRGFESGLRSKRARRDRLTTRKRRALRSTQFALPSRRALPIENKIHAANAAARLEQMRKRGTVSAAEYRSAYKRIKAAERRFSQNR